MGIFGDFIGAVTGKTAAKQARRAGERQARGIERGFEYYRRTAMPQALTAVTKGAYEAGKEMFPFRLAGRGALARMGGILETPYEEYAPAQYTPAAYQAPTAEEVAASPAFQFRMEQAQRAAEMGAAARGGLFGGRHQRELARYMQGLASQEYEAEAARRLREARFQEEQRQFGAGLAERQAQFAPQLDISRRAQLLGGEQFLGDVGFQAGREIAGIRERLGARRAGLRTGSGAAGAAALQSAGQARASGILAGQQARQAAMGQLAKLGGAAAGFAVGGPKGALMGARAF